MAILQLIAEKEKSLCFDFLEEKIREESRKLIESIYADKILNWSEQEKNWYSYKKKPNTGDFGIDCSGFVSNCLTAFCYENKEKHFLNLNSYLQNYVNAIIIRDILCRQLSPTENTSDNSFCQKGDILVSKNHIGFCFDDNNVNNQIPMDKISSTGERGKYFNMIHSCGNLEADDTSKLNVSWVALSGNENNGFHYHQGFFLRILKGPFRHWGTNIQLEKDSNSIGKVQLRRIYLWY